MQLLLEPMLEDITSITIGTSLYLKYKGYRTPIIEIPIDSYLILPNNQPIEIRYNTKLPNTEYTIYNGNRRLLTVTKETSPLVTITQFDTTEASRLIKDYISFLHKSTVVGTELIDSVYENDILPMYLKDIHNETELVSYLYPTLGEIYVKLIVRDIDKLFSITKQMLPNMLYKVDTTKDIIEIYPYINVYEALHTKKKVYEKGV